MRKVVRYIICAATLLLAGCNGVKYNGEKFAPIDSEVAIYQNMAEANKATTALMVIGEISASGPIKSSPRPKLIEKITSAAAKYGASAIVVVSTRVYQERQTAINEITPGVPDSGDSWSRMENDFDYNYGQVGRESSNVPNGPYIREVKALLLRPQTDIPETEQEKLQALQEKYQEKTAE